ncbi:MAG: hypothetical protein MH219_03725 [Marinobacter sp.]|nr:hypothetical protein [Marinobacter sp.]
MLEFEETMMMTMMMKVCLFKVKESELIKNHWIATKSKRKLAAKELGISERTLYRKITNIATYN